MLRAEKPGSNPGPGENTSLKLMRYRNTSRSIVDRTKYEISYDISDNMQVNFTQILISFHILTGVGTNVLSL